MLELHSVSQKQIILIQATICKYMNCITCCDCNYFHLVRCLTLSIAQRCPKKCITFLCNILWCDNRYHLRMWSEPRNIKMLAARDLINTRSRMYILYIPIQTTWLAMFVMLTTCSGTKVVRYCSQQSYLMACDSQLVIPIYYREVGRESKCLSSHESISHIIGPYVNVS